MMLSRNISYLYPRRIPINHTNEMNKINKVILVLGLVGLTSMILQSFKKKANYVPINSSKLIITGDELDVTKYRTWYRITHMEPNTGDVTGGFLGRTHKGKDGYREIYINSIGEATNKGTAPYNYPAGTIIVKEEYKDKKSWEKKTNPKIKVMKKLESGASPESKDWAYASRLTTERMQVGRQTKFCAGCHLAAPDGDSVFINSDVLSSKD